MYLTANDAKVILLVHIDEVFGAAKYSGGCDR